MKFTVPGQPVPQGSMSAVSRGSGVSMFHSNQAKLQAYRDAVAWSAKARLGEPIEGGVQIRVDFYVKRPQRPKQVDPITKPDLDKLVRAVLDALTGVCFADDSQVVMLTAFKLYAEAEPYTEVSVEACHD